MRGSHYWYMGPFVPIMRHPPVPIVNHRGGGVSLSVHVPKRDPSVFVPLTLNLDVPTLKDDILKSIFLMRP